MANAVVISFVDPYRQSLSASMTERTNQIVWSIAEKFNDLALDSIDCEWVREVWDAQFTECPELDETFNNLHEENGTSIIKLLDKIKSLSEKWLKESGDLQVTLNQSVQDADTSATTTNISQSSFWSLLIQHGVKYKALLALLCYYMESGQKLDATQSLRSLCLSATSLYFVLLSTPGAGAFKIFHPLLYKRALDTYKIALKLHLVRTSPKKKKAGGKKTQTNSQGPGGSSQQMPGKRSRAGSTCSGFSEMDWDISDEEEEGLTPKESQDLTNGLLQVLNSLLLMLDHCPLKRSQESLELTISELVDLTHLETSVANLDFNKCIRRSDLSALAFNAYCGLQKLCNRIHGPVHDTCVQISRFLLPGLLMTHRGSSEITPRGLTVIRDHALHFVKHLMASIGDESFDAVEILVQHLALKVPEKADYRKNASSAIHILLLGLPMSHYSKLVKWFFILAHNEKSAHRQFAIELMGRLLSEMERKKPTAVAHGEHDYGSVFQNGHGEDRDSEKDDVQDDVEQNDEFQPDKESTNKPSSNGLFSSHKFLFGVIFSRCKDSSALVRAKALQTMADVTATASENEVVADVIKNLFDPDRPNDNRETVDFIELLQDPEADLSSVNPLPQSEAFIDFLRKRALDESVYVRKNALQVLENILRFYASQSQDLEHLALELVGILGEHCRDPSVMVRKQIASSLTEIVKAYPDNDTVVHHWVEGVFPLILDVEQKAAEKVIECIFEVLINNIVGFSDAMHTRHFLPWKILQATEKCKMTSYLSRACGQWAKNGLLKSRMLKLLKTHLDTENSNSAWCLLALITSHVPLDNPKYVMEYFERSIHTPEGVGLYTLLQVLRVLLASVSNLDAEERKLLQKDLLALVTRFSIPPELISTAIDIATIISWLESGGKGKKAPPTPKKIASTANSEVNFQGVVDLKAYHASLDEWAIEIIEMIDKDLSQRVLSPEGTELEDTRMTRQIFTLGELAQICPHRINKRLFLLMQGIVFQQGSTKKKAKISQRSLPSTQTQSNEPVQPSFTPTVQLQALTVVTLAKMCLQNEEMAKKVVPAFGRLLSTTSDAALKNNIMYALSDMCVRYASLVDPLLPQMTACLRDPALVVRRTTLTTLIHLLQEDYLKMTAGFFFRILQTMCDEVDEIKDLTMFYMQQRLLKRKPKVMYSYFIESIFHFNGYEGHETYNKMIVSDKEKKLFSLKGKEHQENRMKLYKFMMDHMNDENRFQTTYKLCQEILNGVVEGSVDLKNSSAFELLQDTLSCLASDEIKLASLKAKQEGDEIDPNTEPSNVEQVVGELLQSAAKKKIISAVVKRSYMEYIIPIIVALKHKLEKLKSPLLDDLMNCLRELMKDYKNEVKEILAADKQLATEIQYDLKKWETEMEERRKREEEERDEEISPSQDRLQMLRAVIKSAQAMKQKQPQNTKETSEKADEDVPERPQRNNEDKNAEEQDENQKTRENQTPIKKTTHAAAIPFDIAECTVNDLSPKIILERSKQMRSMLMNHTDTLHITESGEKVLQNNDNDDDNNDNGSQQNELQPNLESADSEPSDEKTEKEKEVGIAEEENENEKEDEIVVEENENVENIAKETSDDDSANESMEEDEVPTVIEAEAAARKDLQSKQPNEPEVPEPDPEVPVDQNQDDDPNEDSDWADVTTDEANNEPQKAGPSAATAKGKKIMPAIKKSAKFNLRAISTPNRNESHLQTDVTFMNQSEADISAIPVLSPPTPTRKKSSKKTVNEASFQWGQKKRGRDLFDEIASNEPSAKTSRSSNRSKTKPAKFR